MAAGVDGTVPSYDAPLVSSLVEDTWSRGDAIGGKTIFHPVAVGCATCHKVNNAVAWVGPDLSAVGTTVPLPRIIEEVLWPARQVKERYTLTSLIMEDGKIVQGYERKQKDSSEELLLMDVSTARLKRITIDQIEERNEAGSPMPAGLTSGLTRSQLLDLFRYLASLGTGD